MKHFVFPFESLLQYRRHRRDLCRQQLADVLSIDGGLQERRAGLSQQRTGQLEQIRQLHSAGRLDVDRSASRRYFAGHVLIDIRQVDLDRETVARQLALCRQALVQADRDVKALEKLRDKQHEQFLYEERRRETRELDESWQAAQQAEEVRP